MRRIGPDWWLGMRSCIPAVGPDITPSPIEAACGAWRSGRAPVAPGSCLDGAGAESFFATIKTEIGMDYRPNRATARRDIENWITEYNERRLHSSLGYQTPVGIRAA